MIFLGSVKVDSSKRLTLIKEVAEILNVEKEDNIMFFINDGEIVIRKVLPEQGIMIKKNMAEFDDWVPIDGEISYLFREGNLKRRGYMFKNEKLKADIMYRYRCKAEHDYDEMEEMKAALNTGKKPRKKYRNSNCFVDTRLSYQFPLIGRTREEAIDEAVRRMVTGREGLFVLITNRPLTAEETLKYYRDRNAVETAFRDLKHGID